MRAALYYAPAQEDPLWTAGATWLGRDPDSGAAVAQPDLPDIAAITRAPRLYGFHATLKPPMRLRRGWDAFLDDTDALARRVAPFRMPALSVSLDTGFIALLPTAACPPLRALADACVGELDGHRVPPDEAELERRRAGGLSPDQDANLVRWGYPNVFAAWRFHMTLSRRLTSDEAAALLPSAQAHFRPALDRPRDCDALCVFTQAAPDGPFLLAERLPLRG